MKTWLGIVAALGGAVAAISKFDEFQKFVVDRWERHGSVELRGSYPNEIWRQASPKDFSWLNDEWCYPSLPRFVSRFKVEGGKLFRQNEGGPPLPKKTEWIPTTVYLSNHNVLRIAYPKETHWPIDFIEIEPGRAAEWREYQRNIQDDGSVSSGRKRLVLSCKRCTISNHGVTYECK